MEELSLDDYTFLWQLVVGLASAVNSPNTRNISRAYAINSATQGIFQSVPKVPGTAQFILGENGRVNGSNTVVSNNLRSTLSPGAASEIVYGEFSDVKLGLWGNPEIIVSPHDVYGSRNIMLFVDADVSVDRATSFAFASDITAAGATGDQG